VRFAYRTNDHMREGAKSSCQRMQIRFGRGEFYGVCPPILGFNHPERAVAGTASSPTVHLLWVEKAERALETVAYFRLQLTIVRGRLTLRSVGAHGSQDPIDFSIPGRVQPYGSAAEGPPHGTRELALRKLDPLAVIDGLLFNLDFPSPPISTQSIQSTRRTR
jgi:hypothetical protein